MDAEGQRYRLVETVRQYAQDRLDDSGEGDAARTRHLVFYLALAEKASPELVGPGQGMWLARLDLEGENLLAAHAWCDRAEGWRPAGTEVCLRGEALHVLSRASGTAAPGHVGGARPAGSARANPCTVPRASYRWPTGLFMGRYDEAQGYLEESLSIAREIGDKGRAGSVLAELGAVAIGQGDLATAQRHFEQALVVGARSWGTNVILPLRPMRWRSFIAWKASWICAEPLYEQGLALARELEDRESIAIGLLNLAMVSIGRGVGRSCTRHVARGACHRRRDRLEACGAERAGGLGRTWRVAQGMGRGPRGFSALPRRRWRRRAYSAIPPMRRFWLR